MPAYSVLPSLMQWQQDSSAFLAERREDIILMRIDNIVDALQRTKAEGEPLYLQAELYFATNYWLKTLALGKNPKLKKGRETAIRNLCQFAITQLAAACKVSIQALPNELEKLYGKGLSDHGQHQDSAQVLGTTHYMQRAETNRYRFHFKDGKAYQFEFRVPKPKLKIVNSRFWFKWTVDNSKIIIDPKTGETFRLLADDWGYFVMSMSRDICMGPHRTINPGQKGEGEIAVAHSSWLAGTVVQ